MPNTLTEEKTPIISIVGLSGSGKTTLVEKLVAELKGRGYRIGTIKHSCHPHPLDAEGKDSWRHKKAGAERTLFVGPKCLQLVSDIPEDPTPSPSALTEGFLSEMDLVIVEGFLQADTVKIEVVRSERSKRPVCSSEEGLVAVASDIKRDAIPGLGDETPLFALDDPAGISDFIVDRLSLTSKPLRSVTAKTP